MTPSDLKSWRANLGLTQEYLREALAYESDTGEFHWKRKPRNALAGKLAGGLTSSGQLAIQIDGKTYMAHALAWLYVHGTLPEMIDHINGDPLDNRVTNLRLCTPSQNQWNRGVSKNNTSGFKGVSWRARRSKWYAAIQVYGKTKYLGSFDTAEAAAEAYSAAARLLHGDWTRES